MNKKYNLNLAILGLILSGFLLHATDERVYYPTETPTKRIAGQEQEQLPPLHQWHAFQLAFAPGFPSATTNSNVNGLKLGIPASGGDGRVWGTEISVFSSSTSNIRGFQTSIFTNVADFVEGVQAGLINIVNVGGDCPVQFGLVNYSDETGVQFGLVNVIGKGSLPFFPVFNIDLEPQTEVIIQKAPKYE